MFAVFADTWGGEEVNGCGNTPQMAWENLLGGYDIKEHELDMENVRFFERVNPDRVSMVTTTEWVLDSDE